MNIIFVTTLKKSLLFYINVLKVFNKQVIIPNFLRKDITEKEMWIY